MMIKISMSIIIKLRIVILKITKVLNQERKLIFHLNQKNNTRGTKTIVLKILMNRYMKIIIMLTNHPVTISQITKIVIISKIQLIIITKNSN